MSCLTWFSINPSAEDSEVLNSLPRDMAFVGDDKSEMSKGKARLTFRYHGGNRVTCFGSVQRHSSVLVIVQLLDVHVYFLLLTSIPFVPLPLHLSSLDAEGCI